MKKLLIILSICLFAGNVWGANARMTDDGTFIVDKNTITKFPYPKQPDCRWERRCVPESEADNWPDWEPFDTVIIEEPLMPDRTLSGSSPILLNVPLIDVTYIWLKKRVCGEE